VHPAGRAPSSPLCSLSFPVNRNPWRTRDGNKEEDDNIYKINTKMKIQGQNKIGIKTYMQNYPFIQKLTPLDELTE
jgi:hypothetical protein